SLPTNSCSLTLRADREDDDQTSNPVDIVEDQKAVPGTTTQLPRGSDHRLAKKRLAVRRGRVRFKDQVVLDHPPNQRVVLALDRLYVVARQHVEDDFESRRPRHGENCSHPQRRASRRATSGRAARASRILWARQPPLARC